MEVPKSHKFPLLGKIINNLKEITSRHFNDMDSIYKVLNEEQIKQFKPKPILLKPGEACFHHGK
jgi:hypothetical protein